MGRPRKKVSEMTDQELLRRVFPPEVRREAKKVIAELNAEKLKRQTAKKGSKKR